MERLARGVVRYRWTVIGTVALLTAVLAVFASRVRIDAAVEMLIDPGDPEVRYYDRIRETFGSGEVDVVAVVADDVFTVPTLQKIKGLSETLRDTPGVERVVSVATESDIRATPEGDIAVTPLMEEVPAGPAEIARLRRRVHDNPLFAGNLVAADDTAAAILVTYASPRDGRSAARRAHAAVEAAVAAASGPERVYLTGAPTLKATSEALMQRDLLLFAIASPIVIAMVLFLSFRSLRGVLLPLVTTGIGIVWTVGLMGWFDVPIDIGTLVLPSLLVAIGNTYATHVVARYYDEVQNGGSREEIVCRTIGRLGVPVLVTAVTTVLGFASLAAYRATAIRHLGIFSVLGIVALFVLALSFTGAMLAVLKVRSGGREVRLQRLDAFLERLGAFGLRHHVAVMAGAVVVLAGFAWGIRYVRVDTGYLSYFPEDSPVRQGTRVVGEHLGGADSFLVVVETAEEDGVARLDVLRRMAALQDFIDRLPGTGKTTSIVDYVKLLNRLVHGDDPAYFSLPDTDAAVRQLLVLLDPAAVEDVVNGDYSSAAILVRAHLGTSSALADVVSRIRRFAADAFPPEIAVRSTGGTVIFNRLADDLSRGQLQSLAVAAVSVFAALSLQFLSMRFGAVAMVPNLVPIVMFFGILGWGGISLSISTAMIASISLGLGVDEAIHLLAEFKHQLGTYADEAQAALLAVRGVGPPLVVSTAALFLGFLIPVCSNFVPVRQFGALTAIIVVPSLFADLLLLPALLASTRFVTLWELVTVKLGGAPHETIPLFRGLRRSQARLAVLMGVLRTVRRGDRIVSRGEPGDEMYVVIRGRAEVRGQVGGRSVVLGQIERGDVVGEMGLVRARPRATDVVACEDTELLVVDERFLRVLQRRYPRTAAVVLFNLTRILSDRLERADERLLGR